MDLDCNQYMRRAGVEEPASIGGDTSRFATRPLRWWELCRITPGVCAGKRPNQLAPLPRHGARALYSHLVTPLNGPRGGGWGIKLAQATHAWQGVPAPSMKGPASNPRALAESGAPDCWAASLLRASPCLAAPQWAPGVRDAVAGSPHPRRRTPFLGSHAPCPGQPASRRPGAAARRACPRPLARSGGRRRDLRAAQPASRAGR